MIQGLITLIIYIVILGLIVWLANYIADAIPLPEPFNRLLKIAVIVVAVLVVIVLLLQLVGGTDLSLPKVGGLYEIRPFVADSIPVIVCQSNVCTASL